MAAFISALAAASTSHAIIISTFDTDTDGWTKLSGSDASSSVEWISTGGNPGGFLRYDEVGSGFVDFVAAPVKFLGSQSGAYGKTLSFDIMTNTLSDPTNFNDQVKLISDGLTLRYQLPNPEPVNEWHHREIELTETSGWINNSTGLAPSQADMTAVLSNLTGLHLLTDYRNGPEQVAYDNITLVPEPPTTALLFVGAAAVFVALRRRKK
ncbi:MAG: laminin B domain-containing protein [Kiritimatiellia bacterium]